MERRAETEHRLAVRVESRAAFDALWLEINRTVFCPVCGQEYANDGRPNWSKSKKCPECRKLGRGNGLQKRCKYCGTMTTLEEFKKRPGIVSRIEEYETSHDVWVSKPRPSSGWGAFTCCERCKSFIKELRKLCDGEVSR